jgi:hypothetical protein
MGISDSHLGVPKQNDIWVLVSWPSIEYNIKGKVVASLKSGLWWVLWIYIYLWFVRAPKCSNYALTNLLFDLCRFVWVIEVFINLPSLIPKLQHSLLPSKCYEPRNTPQVHLLLLFTFGLIVESIKELGGAWNFNHLEECLIITKTYRLCQSVKLNGLVKSKFHRWRAPKSRGETHLRVSQSQVAESWDLEARSQLPTLERGRGSSWEPRD